MNILKLHEALARKYGDYWDYEIETLSIDMGAVFDEMAFGKIATLISLNKNPDHFTHYADYFLRFVEVANDESPDELMMHLPTSLDLVWALTVLDEMGKGEVTDCIKGIVDYILDEEGHGEAFHPILAKYSTKQGVTTRRTRAATTYIKGKKAGL